MNIILVKNMYIWQKNKTVLAKESLSFI